MSPKDIITIAYERVLPSANSAGCTLPSFENAIARHLGSGNFILHDQSQSIDDLNIDIANGAKDNIIILGSSYKNAGILTFIGASCIVAIGRNLKAQTLNIHVHGQKLRVIIGENYEVRSASLFCTGTEKEVVLGDDGLLSHGISIRNNDDHGIFDIETNEHINPPKDILIEPHVWICPNSTILKGAKIGMGSVIGTNSVVSGKIPPLSLAAGTPAKVLKKNITWDHSLYPRIDHVKSNLMKIQDFFKFNIL